MPLNISGSILASDSADTLDERSIVTRGLVYHLDAESPNCYAKAGSTRAHDISGAMINSGVMHTGTCLTFDGTNDHVTFSSIGTTYEESLTVTAWVKTGNTDGWRDVLAGGCGDILFGVSSADNGTLSFGGQCNDPFNPMAGTTNIADDAWHFVCATYDGSTAKIYVDGALDGSASKSGAIDGDTAKSWGGSASSESWDGELADCRIYDVVLNASQVSELYRSPNTVLPTGISVSSLVGWWPLMEGSGTTAYDCSGNENHGTLTNMDPSSDWIGGQTDIPQLAGKGHSTKMVHDGSNDSATIANAGTDDIFNFRSSDFTIACWLHPYSIGSQGIFTKQPDSRSGGWHMSIKSTGDLSVDINQYAEHYSLSTKFAANKWQHFAFVRDQSSSIKVYLDGVLVYTNTESDAYGRDAGANLQSVKWGGSGEPYTGFFSGIMDECAVWNAALDIDDMITLANKSNGKPNPPDARTIEEPSLKGYWRNDGLGKWKDLSGNGRHGIVSGSPSKVYFPRGIDENRDSQGFFSPVGTFKLDGLKDFIKPADNALFNIREQITVLTWIRPNGSGTTRRIINKEEDNASSDRPFSIVLGTSDKLYVAFNDYDVVLTADTALSDGVWYHVGFTYNKDAGGTDELKIYLNGVIDGIANYSTILDSNSKVPGIGAGYIYNANPDSPFDGDMANVQIYNKELSLTEIQHNYNVQRDRFGV